MALVAGLSACTSEPGVDASGSPGVSTSGSTSAGAGQWDPRAWVPTVTIVPVSMTEAQKVSWRAQWLADTAKQTGVPNTPDVELVRWTEGRAEHDHAVADCLTEAGFAAKPAADGGVDLVDGVPPSQMSAFSRASYVCESQYTLDPVYSQEWTTDQLDLVFDYWTQFYLPCLQAHGVPTDTGAVPTKEAWVAAFHTSERVKWWGDEALQSVPATTQQSVREECALYPPDDVFYGQ